MKNYLYAAAETALIVGVAIVLALIFPIKWSEFVAIAALFKISHMGRVLVQFAENMSKAFRGEKP